MNFKKLIAILLLVCFFCVSAPAETEYITDVSIDGKALDIPEPTPEPTPGSTPEPTPGPTMEPAPESTDSETDYQIEVDLENQIVTVYRGNSRSRTSIARQMICSSGTGNNTPTGEFIMPEQRYKGEREEWYYIGKYRLYVQWASRIVDSILFHSLPSEYIDQSPTQDSTLALGERASHGCIRLRPADSKWIAENCPAGTPVEIFEDAKPNESLRKMLLESSFVSEEMNYARFLKGEKVYSISSGSPEVTRLQLKLDELGYKPEESDGVFGAGTHRAVLRWQRDNGFEATGEVNEEQFARIMEQEVVRAEGSDARVEVEKGLWLRSEPDSKSKKIGLLSDGDIVHILEEADGWYKIRFNGKTGYAGSKYIKILNKKTEVE